MQRWWLLALGACGGSVDGSIDGHEPTFATLVAQLLTEPEGILVQFSSRDDGCDALAATNLVDMTRMELYLDDRLLGPHAFEYGPTAPGGPGQGWLHVYDSDGVDVRGFTGSRDDFATVGTIDMTSVAGPIEGTYDVTFDDGHLAGSFSAPLCP